MPPPAVNKPDSSGSPEFFMKATADGGATIATIDYPLVSEKKSSSKGRCKHSPLLLTSVNG